MPSTSHNTESGEPTAWSSSRRSAGRSSTEQRRRRLLPRLAGAAIATLALLAGCANHAGPSGVTTRTEPVEQQAFLDAVEHRTFDFFWQTTNAQNGLTPDRWPTHSFSSIAAIGFALSAYPVGVERGWVGRGEAASRTLTTLRFFWTSAQGPQARGVTGYRGFYYHFLDMQTGERFQNVELSTIDTALLMAGILTAQQYFDGTDATETEIRALADSLYRRAEWDWIQPRPPLIAMAWKPAGSDYQGFLDHDYQGYCEAMILYLLALGSPTHPISPAAWDAFTSTYDWADFYGYSMVNFAPLFGHQYSHVWVDFRGIQDAYMRAKGIDYFENSRRATYSQQAYAEDDPMAWRGYGENSWGLTASDGPGGFQLTIDGKQRQFHAYSARGAAATRIVDDGTLVPTAAGGSIPFAPEIAIPALQDMEQRYGDHLFRQYGFIDAFNLTLSDPGAPIRTGSIVPGVGWFDVDYLGIDQGPIVLMIENYRSGLIWKLMRESPYIVRGLCRAGFQGGWLAGRC